MNYPKHQTLAFTGHRDIKESDRAELHKRLKDAVIESYKLGYRYFINGMALGFDMLAAEVVLDLRESYEDIHLIAAVPFPGQESRWPLGQQNRYNQILDEADEVFYVSSYFERGCEMKRNRWMIDRANHLIAYFNGEPHGGTYFTYHRAEEQGKTISNLYK